MEKLSANDKAVVKYLKDLFKSNKIGTPETNPTIEIVLYRDDGCDMSLIKINNCRVYEGNEWDFHPGSHGMPFDFKGSYSLANLFKEAAINMEYENVSLTVEDYEYE